ncbi:putative membrane protein YdjX (TVP38/TMEM64 family) [Rhodoligotrophos appendicifer]|uniref:TVP38/TMEM64 family protein n=1 Tax=Rhodoligotrophos appendicifer TaxID=987056 RepID=UPI001186C9C6|nr:TVP38/TMEM64 family protein [Rhodoligotrophos appendicifer]
MSLSLPMKKLKLSYLLILLLLLAAMAAHLSGVAAWLDIKWIAAHRDELLNWVEARPIASGALFIVFYAAVVALSLPAATVLTLLGGFLFGRWIGTALVVVGATLGAVAIFSIAKTSFGEGLRSKAGPLYQKVAANMQENAFGYLLFMRLVPVFPFFLVNIVPAMFSIETGTFALATFIGIIPGSFVYANLGGELSTITDPGDLISAKTLIAFSLLGVMALVPTLYRQWCARGSKAG